MQNKANKTMDIRSVSAPSSDFLRLSYERASCLIQNTGYKLWIPPYLIRISPNKLENNPLLHDHYTEDLAYFIVDYKIKMPPCLVYKHDLP